MISDYNFDVVLIRKIIDVNILSAHQIIENLYHTNRTCIVSDFIPNGYKLYTADCIFQPAFFY